MAMQDKTEAATPRKREEARAEGKVAKSVDLSSAVVLLASLLMLKVAGPFVMSGLSSLVKDSLSNLHNHSLNMEDLQALSISWGMRFGVICLPVAVGTAAIGLMANVLQVGFRITPKAIAPDFTRLDPIKGLARLVSGKALVEVLKSTIKVGIVVYFIYSFLKNEHPVLIDLASMSPEQLGTVSAQLCWRLLARGCIAVLVIGVFDYIYQRFSFEMGMRMSKQEVKDEFKRTEGDPQVKGKIKQRQRELARRRMVQDVARADVVLTNPTHFAVALKYDSATMSAPTVVAKGQRLLAQKIKEVAAASGVPIVENPPVARLLYKTVEVGQQIPEALYQTVAEILAYVYQLSKKAGVRTHHTNLT